MLQQEMKFWTILTTLSDLTSTVSVCNFFGSTWQSLLMCYEKQISY